MSNYKLSDICKIRYGKDHKSLDNGNIPVYGTGGIMRYVDSTLYEKESVLIPRKGTLSNLFYVDEPFWTIDTLFYTEIDKSKVLPKYLYFKLKTIDLAGMNVGTAVPSLTTALLNEIELNIPSLENQIKIVDILSSLENKIENNNAIIANLEEQAQTIFKSWFVDFEPFQKEEFIDNTIGLIPTSFESISLGELYKLRSGYAFKSKDWTDKGFPVIKIKDIQPPTIDLNNIDYVNDMNVIEKAVDFKVCGGEIVMALTGATTGKFGIIPDINEAYVNQRVGLFLDSTESGYGYLYGLLNQEQFISKVIELAQGSAQANLSPRDVNNLLVPYNKNAFEKYNSLINPMMSHIALILNENQSLRETRDTLLPKLMSGEIRVEDTIEVKEM